MPTASRGWPRPRPGTASHWSCRHRRSRSPWDGTGLSDAPSRESLARPIHLAGDRSVPCKPPRRPVRRLTPARYPIESPSPTERGSCNELTNPERAFGYGAAGAMGRRSRAARALAQAFGRVPPTALLLLSILSIQLSSALATTLFADLGPSGTVFLSAAFAALLLAVFSRPKIDRRDPPGCLADPALRPGGCRHGPLLLSGAAIHPSGHRRGHQPF